ncbi:MAG: DUF4912 domain-containing protein [Nitrospirota bacterium]
MKKKATTKKIAEKTKKKAKRKETKKAMNQKRFMEVKVREKKTTSKAVKKEIKPKIAKKISKKPAGKIEVKKKEVPLPRKAVLRKPKKVLYPVIEERYPPMPWEALPAEYGEDSITLMTVDPKKLFAYWEVGEDVLAKHSGVLNIRVYDVTGVDFDGMNANSYFDIAVNGGIGSWYIDVGPAKEFVADIGIINPQGIFITIARSNKVSTPQAEITEEGVLPQELYKTGLHIGY